jgi:DNA-binding IclR family transcriptional regulator
VADSGSAGRTREDLDTILRQAVTVEIRIQAMLRDGMIVESEGEYRLTPKGWGWARTFLAWNDLVGMERGG